jgi:acetyl-CoA decarbonylase/synthase complex subunit delta
MPKIGIEISDLGFDSSIPGLKKFYEGADTVAQQAALAAKAEGVDFVCLRLDSADPNGKNASVDECAATAKAVCEAIDKPLAIMGCKNVEKDTELFVKVSEVLQGKNVLILSAREEDYKTVGASAVLAYGQKIGAESAVDINLAKQLNVLLSQLGVASSSMVMNLGSAAAGYGFEYVASTMDRVKSAALAQNDAMLQMPVVTPVGGEAWSVKEALLEEADMPQWGSREERGIQMEIITAAACLASGSDAVILRHPESVKTISDLVSALM